MTRLATPARRNQAERVEDALHELLAALDAGREYPDVLAKTAQSHNITPAALQAAYDNLG